MANSNLTPEVARSSGPSVDALVLILGNADFIDWVSKKYALLKKKRNQTQEGGELNEIELQQRDKVEMMSESMVEIDKVSHASLKTDFFFYLFIFFRQQVNRLRKRAKKLELKTKYSCQPRA